MNPLTKTGYGMLWLNSNAMEAVLQPTPAITLRSLGGIFDLFFIGKCILCFLPICYNFHKMIFPKNFKKIELFFIVISICKQFRYFMPKSMK